jgi:hypothetical protein
MRLGHHYLQPGGAVADRCHAAVHLLCIAATLMPVNASFRRRSSSSGVHGGFPITGVISSPELDSEALHFDA